jgi:glutaredoxin
MLGTPEEEHYVHVENHVEENSEKPVENVEKLIEDVPEEEPEPKIYILTREQCQWCKQAKQELIDKQIDQSIVRVVDIDIFHNTAQKIIDKYNVEEIGVPTYVFTNGLKPILGFKPIEEYLAIANSVDPAIDISDSDSDSSSEFSPRVNHTINQLCKRIQQLEYQVLLLKQKPRDVLDKSRRDEYEDLMIDLEWRLFNTVLAGFMSGALLTGLSSLAVLILRF